MESDANEIAALRQALTSGRDEPLDELFASVYNELRRLARGQRRRWRGDETLNTTALIHEAYLKLSAGAQPRWESRGHFFAVAATAMRQILIDRARHSNAEKRGGGQEPQALPGGGLPEIPAGARDDLLALDEALGRLEALDARQARIVECRFFGGFGVEETAEAVGVSTATVKRDWRSARAWLYQSLTADEPPD